MSYVPDLAVKVTPRRPPPGRPPQSLKHWLPGSPRISSRASLFTDRSPSALRPAVSLTPTTMNIIPNSADSASATVVPSIIIIFLPGVTAQHQEDVSNSFELAARAATKQVSGTNYTRWFRVFQTVLRNIHWFTLQAESERTIRDPVLDIIPVDDSERHLASEALRALQNPEYEDALRLFCDQHPTGRAAREDIRQLFFGGGGRYTRPAKFQLALCSEVNEDVSVSSFFLRLHNRGPAGATIGFHKYGLNTRLFERLRSGLKKKLEDSGESKQVRIEY